MSSSLSGRCFFMTVGEKPDPKSAKQNILTEKTESFVGLNLSEAAEMHRLTRHLQG